MRISSNSNAGKMAGAIAGLLRAGETATLEAIGANTTYKAVKAIDICRIFLKDENMIPAVTITSVKRMVNGIERDTMLLTVKGECNG